MEITKRLDTVPSSQFWELLWVNCLKLDWREAKLYASYLVEHSKWSRTIYSYQQAAVMLMNDDLDDNELETVESLMHDTPKYKQRIAGKSLPMEKFICKKVARYFAQNHYLCLPAVELMFVWNAFKVLSKNYQLADAQCSSIVFFITWRLLSTNEAAIPRIAILKRA
ncbi:tetratricopeptide repeat protein 39B-like isoform X3 [Zeugodacus cucurbitae]|uniref:tetratricopeptide repeat protein 39B-like isoform X3 n=1 Tax=Zeugodacus cucurbitae TaxID=28588 RepID=UPI0023D96AD0|nr:tetratricopeptide repeat protein 39B-like isoform X3 [Zeugodacus cucurbitae]